MKWVLQVLFVLVAFSADASTWVGFRLINNGSGNLPANTYAYSYRYTGWASNTWSSAGGHSLLGPGGSEDKVVDNGGTAGNLITVRIVLNSSGAVVASQEWGVGQTGTNWYYVVSSNWYCSKISVKNVDSVYAAFAFLVDGTMEDWSWVEPGKTWTKEKCDSVYHVLQFQRLSYASGEPTYDGDPFGQQQNWTNSSTGSVTPTNAVNNVDHQYSGSTTNINWGTNSPDPGIAAVYDALIKFAAVNHEDLQTVLNRNTYLSNYNSVTVSNSTDMSGVTNLLTQIRNNATNNADGNSVSNQLSAGASGGGATNWAFAEGQVNGVLDSSGVNTGLDTLIGRLGVPTLPGGDGSGWTMLFCGQTIDLNPVTRFPTVAAASILGFTVVLWVAFVRKMGELFTETVKTITAVQTGGVPNLEAQAATFGGNVLGIAVALAVPLIFVTAWAILVAWLLNLFLSHFTEAIGFTSWASSLGGKGWYLLVSFFPVQLAVTLCLTGVVLHFTIGKVVLIAAGASRFLWGK